MRMGNLEGLEGEQSGESWQTEGSWNICKTKEANRYMPLGSVNGIERSEKEKEWTQTQSWCILH